MSSVFDVAYNGLYEKQTAKNKASLKSMNLGQFDRLRCQLESKGLDHFGSALMAKEFLALVKAGTFSFNEITTLVQNMAIGQSGLRFTQLYLDSLNSQRSTSSRLDLIGDQPIPDNVSRAIIF